ncbi:hypothetical protein MRX96_019250 [Rhipicephalus microplus]
MDPRSPSIILLSHSSLRSQLARLSPGAHGPPYRAHSRQRRQDGRLPDTAPRIGGPPLDLRLALCHFSAARSIPFELPLIRSRVQKSEARHAASGSPRRERTGIPVK